jgi:hypothetical protein
MVRGPQLPVQWSLVSKKSMALAEPAHPIIASASPANPNLFLMVNFPSLNNSKNDGKDITPSTFTVYYAVISARNKTFCL